MKIEAGKYYKTRDGHRAFVGAVSPFPSTDRLYLVVGWIQGESASTSWGPSGEYADGSNAPEDLVAEWVDPPTPLEVCRRIDALANDPDVKISWPYLSQIVSMAREAIAAAEPK
jgi:hypothetical protein